MRTRLRRAVALTAAASFALVACGNGDSDDGADGSDAGGADAADGSDAGEPQTLRVAFNGDSENYDPQQPPQTVTRVISRQIADTLTDQDPETGEILPFLAESWEISEDVTEFTFTLRDDVTFSDGTPLTAEVVEANFDRVIELGALSRVAGGQLAGYIKSEVVDEHTITVHFEQPNAQFLQATASQPLGILAPATLDLSPEEAAAGDVIGTGPYVLESYSPDAGIVLTAREDYAWGSPNYDNDGASYFDRVEISFITEPTTIAGALTGGQIDLAFELGAASVSTIEGSGTARVETLPAPGIAIPLLPLPQSEVLSEAATRQALNHATDRDTIAATVYQGLQEPATSVLNRFTPYYADLSEHLTHDPDRAVELLEEAGWTQVGDDGIRTDADGERLSIVTQYAQGSSHELLWQSLQQQWADVGIELVIEPVADLSDYQLHTYPFDISTWSQGRAEPDVLRTVYSSFFEGQSVRFDDPDEELDALLVDLQSAVDPDERQAVSTAVQEYILEQGYAVPIFDSVRFIGVSEDLQGFNWDIEGKPIFHDLSF